MNEHDNSPSDAEDGDQDEFKLTGEAATAQWRRVRFDLYATFVAAGVLVVLSLFLWHRTPDQLTWIGFGATALCLAVLIWRHNLVRWSYPGTDGPEPTFTAKRPPVPRALAAPVLLVAGILLVLAGTSTGPGRVLATIFGVIKTLYDAGLNVVKLVWTPIGIGVIVFLAAIPLYVIGWGVYFLIGFVFRGFRRDPDGGTGIKILSGGLALLALEAFIAYDIARHRDLMMNEWLAPFRTIVGWFN